MTTQRITSNPFKKWPRNLPCFCGSGRKFKKCCNDKIGGVVKLEEYSTLKQDYDRMLNYIKNRGEEVISHGDCLTKLNSLAKESVHALITDPPAGISFMGKSWDDDKGGRDQWVSWLSEVMRECLRVMKPGAHGLVWAIPRTSHWTATALENAGFEVRDVVTHLFGSGFPKSQNISIQLDKQMGALAHRGKAFVTAGRGDRHDIQDQNPKKMPPHEAITDSAKQWQGFGTALKPASEHWILIRKPISEKTVAKNVLKHGVGGINIDGCRIDGAPTHGSGKVASKGLYELGHKDKPRVGVPNIINTSGRFPANLVFSHSDYCTDTQCDIECAIKQLDLQSGNLKNGGQNYTTKGKSLFGTEKNLAITKFAGDSGGASRFFYCAKASKADKNAGLDNTIKKAIGNRPNSADMTGKFPDHDQRERVGNFHPTVKSTKLMQYLIKLITPPNGTVLDPFMGSGSTGVACKALGFKFIGIEKEKEYFEIAKTRIEKSVSA